MRSYYHFHVLQISNLSPIASDCSSWNLTPVSLISEVLNYYYTVGLIRHAPKGSPQNKNLYTNGIFLTPLDIN